MHAIRRSVALLVMLPSAAIAQSATGATTSAAPSTLQREIDAANRGMEAAFAKGDLQAVSRFYADDAVIMGPNGQRIRGRQAIDRYWATIPNPVRWKLDAFDVGGSSTQAYQLGRSTLTFRPNGNETTSVTDFIVIWKRTAAGWRISVDMWPGGS